MAAGSDILCYPRSQPPAVQCIYFYFAIQHALTAWEQPCSNSHSIWLTDSCKSACAFFLWQNHPQPHFMPKQSICTPVWPGLSPLEGYVFEEKAVRNLCAPVPSGKL